MLNVGGGGMDELEQGMVGKSAFMDLQQQQMPPGMAHPAYSGIRTSYPSQHHHQHEGVFSTPQHSRAALGYPFAMNSMGPGGYSAAPSHFSMSPYQTPSPPRDGLPPALKSVLASLSSKSRLTSWNMAAEGKTTTLELRWESNSPTGNLPAQQTVSPFPHTNPPLPTPSSETKPLRHHADRSCTVAANEINTQATKVWDRAANETNHHSTKGSDRVRNEAAIDEPPPQVQQEWDRTIRETNQNTTTSPSSLSQAMTHESNRPTSESTRLRNGDEERLMMARVKTERNSPPTLPLNTSQSPLPASPMYDESDEEEEGESFPHEWENDVMRRDEDDAYDNSRHSWQGGGVVQEFGRIVRPTLTSLAHLKQVSSRTSGDMSSFTALRAATIQLVKLEDTTPLLAFSVVPPLHPTHSPLSLTPGTSTWIN
ncbi:hypothetical protein BaRGS_00026692 [Batillaria attramentaria]|uniref:Uncharacterized protein n=1 Tax=Batillaria attramentaria TaxID=370345 RepID=A0ABD0K554_9CAEN